MADMQYTVVRRVVRLLRCQLVYVAAMVAFAIHATPSLAADCVTPKPGATSGATFRDAPKASAAGLGQLQSGRTAPLIASIPRWYETRTSSGQVAFVSKQSTTLVTCADAPEPAGLGGQSFELHAIDVGTGLAILVRGPDFSLLYDAGSNDDRARGDDNRVIAYLRSLTPPITRIDHLILSHPHQDHVELMPDILHEFTVKSVWDSGVFHTICGYRHFLRALADEPGVSYRTATRGAGLEAVELPTKTCYGRTEQAEEITLTHQTRIDDAQQNLGSNASMTILHADGSKRPSFNANSLVVRLDLGPHKVLLTGDAEAGGRKDPSETPAVQSIEGKLLACCASDLKADVLVVGHHGSMTSSRKAFLDAVEADFYVISSGPKKYSGIKLPDEVVLSELDSRGEVFRTDLDDVQCADSSDKIGPDSDGKAGGCDNILIKLPMNGAIAGEYRRVAD